MQTEVRDSGPFERIIVLELAADELERHKDRAARKLSRDLKIKGFRPGKAPRKIVEQMVGAAALRSEAIEEALPEVVAEALEGADLDPVTTPRVEEVRDTDDGGVSVDVRITLWPVADRVPDITNRKIVVEPPGVTDDELDEQLDRLRSQFAELEDVDRPGDQGDFALINLTTLHDGAEIAEAAASDLSYEIGSRSFIPGLDELLAGAKAGDIREGKGTLPEGYGEHAGRDVVLRVLVKKIMATRLPEVDDEWVSDVSEFDTVDELVDQLRANLLMMKRSTAVAQLRDRVVEQLVEELDVELPEALVEAEMEGQLHNLVHTLEQQGIDLGNYLRITGQEQDAFVAELRSRSSQALKTRILLEGVAREEDLQVSDDELAEYAASLARAAGQDATSMREALRRDGREQLLVGDILRRKALDRLLETATPIDAEGNAVELLPTAEERDEAGDTAAPAAGDAASAADVEKLDDRAETEEEE